MTWTTGLASVISLKMFMAILVHSSIGKAWGKGP